MFDEVNRLASGSLCDFRLYTYDGSRLVVVGSSDLCYYHNVEITFTDVASINCPAFFHDPIFREGRKRDGNRVFRITTPEGRWEITADDVSVEWVTVYYYPLGSQRLPSELIAAHVRRNGSESRQQEC